MDYRPRMARWLARTRFGQNALVQGEDLTVFKQKPSPRVLLGLVLMGLSFLLPWPGMALTAYFSLSRQEPWVLLAGSVAVFVVVHLIFIAGVFLAGGNYAMALLRWGAARFINKHLPLA